MQMVKKRPTQPDSADDSCSCAGAPEQTHGPGAGWSRMVAVGASPSRRRDGFSAMMLAGAAKAGERGAMATCDANSERRGAGDGVGKGHIARSTCSVQPDTYLCLGDQQSQPCIAAVGSPGPETVALEPVQCGALRSLQASPRLYAFEFKKHAVGHAAKQRQAVDHAIDASQPFDRTGEVPGPILGVRGWYGDANSTPSA